MTEEEVAQSIADMVTATFDALAKPVAYSQSIEVEIISAWIRTAFDNPGPQNVRPSPDEPDLYICDVEGLTFRVEWDGDDATIRAMLPNPIEYVTITGEVSA